MYQMKGQTLRSQLHNNQISQQSLDSLLKDLEKDSDIQKLFVYVAQLVKNLGTSVQPFVRVNTIIVANKLLTLASYPYLLLAQIYLMPQIQKVIDFLASNTGLQQHTQYFQQQGCSTNIPYIQNLSYNFVTQSSTFVHLASKIKPFRVYQGRQYSQSSVFKKYSQKLSKNLEKSQFPLKLPNSKDSELLRQKYLYSLSNWHEYQGNLLQFFVKMVQQFLCCGIEQNKYALSFNQILKYGQPVVTSEIIARLIEIVSSSYNFKVRTRALKILDNLILWGDVQALLVVNFTQHIQIIVKNILYIKGEISVSQGAKIYPEIGGQEDQKLQFYTFLLRCLQVWGQCYPKNDYFDYENKRKSDQSVVFRLYKLLKQTKKFKFPQNLMITRYEKQTHANMRDKMIRNQLILIGINSQVDSVSILLDEAKSFEEVQQFYQTHKEYLLDILNNGTKQLNDNMSRLWNFKENFQHYVESIQTASGIDQNIDSLIENGLQLIDLIEAIHQPYIMYLKQQYSPTQFKEIVTNACFKYFNQDETKQSQGPFRRFLSQKLKVKKNQLQFPKVRSIPEENELKMIVNDLNIRQLRAKYKRKREKAVHDTKSSQSSVLNLDIYTRTRFSKQSESNENQKKDSSFNLNQHSLKKILSDNFNNKEPLISKKQTSQNGGKGSKKRITVVSKQLSNIDKMPTENDSPFRSKKQSQISTDGTNHKPQTKVQKMLNFVIPANENQHYYDYLKTEGFKYSYTLGHIIIFKSEQLLVQRVISQIIEDNKIKLKIYIILIPYNELSCVSYVVQDQGCIQITDKTKPFPQKLKQQTRYVIELVGQMKKIPLKLPTIAVLVDKTPVLQYILPFTINFFLDCFSNQTEVLSNFQALQSNLHKQLASEEFPCSPVLFPLGNIDSIFTYFPFTIKLSKPGDKKDLYLWEVKHNDLKFLIVIEHYKSQNQMKVKLQTSIASGQTFFAFFKYVLNYMVHLLGDFSYKRT